MKKYMFILSAVMLLFASCDLEEESKVEVPMDFVDNVEKAELVLLGVYQSLTSQYLYGYHLSMLFTLGTDEAQVEGNTTSSPREIPTNFHNASTKEIAQTWNTLYKAIYNANSCIETLERSMEKWSEGDKQLTTYYIAEARALRALYYFELVRWFGNVALVTRTEESYRPNDYFEQADPADVYAFIESDLKYAAEVLPWADDDHVRTSNAFRFSKGGALGLLTKVYCTWAGYPVHDETKWAEAVRTAKIVVESGHHGLLPGFRTLWENSGASVWDSRESLVEVSFYWNSKTGSSDPVGMIGKWNGVQTSQAGNRGTCQARWRVVYPFVQKWENAASDDPRRALSVADYCYGFTGTVKVSGETYTVVDTDGKQNYMDWLETAADFTESKTGKRPEITEEKRDELRIKYTPAKWDVEEYAKNSPLYNQNYNSTINWYVLRYADLLLLYAEALNETQGPTEAAHSALNAVRRRAFGDQSHDLRDLSQDALREAIRNERAYELCFEGHRKSDLIRWGIYYSTIRQTAQDVADWSSTSKSSYIVFNYTREGRHELMPIPQTQLDIMPRFKQNPGWGI
ncbi:RagB/SusD family nutrient uptake outer membrane protein [Alistipes sp. An66]|uniref:RagB/SusD family nutrient uptake outer membrane protein n=1 Tax=Alistipes sp. An66 TaxID=1965650 RepID=UPI000B36BA1B|nr:RagB/SusD family nutrient uptake outer membrane protein [Alistipes sp. An66]OUN59130.1 RagB/SusD family nutrient uptake outer membrane protein [Alistipes sp. An66]